MLRLEQMEDGYYVLDINWHGLRLHLVLQQIKADVDESQLKPAEDGLRITIA